MPIFQADLQHDRRPVDPEPEPEPPAIDRRPPLVHRLSEESIRTELCEGPVPDSPPSSPGPRLDDEAAISSRAELIERLKRGESPTWIPNRHVSTRRSQRLPFCLFYSVVKTVLTLYQLESLYQQTSPPPRPSRSRTPSDSSSLLPPAQITPERDERRSPIDQKLRDGLNIERPRSALHSGDFTVDDAEPTEEHRTDTLRQSASDNTGWVATSPPRNFRPFPSRPGSTPFPTHSPADRSFGTSPLSLSSSFSSSFAYQPPTSPLVQSESNDDLEITRPLNSIDFSSRAGSRRHTLYSAHSSPQISPSHRVPFPLPSPSPRRREGSLPYQAHQPRRSLTAVPSFLQTGSSPQAPALLRTRRPSLGSDSSPIQQHASMVGSYEESILRGRMSTTPSKPLDFLAQIGVLGIGNCKPSCPAHVTLPFPAVYYSYGTTSHGRSHADDGPSPYVGQIDLENGLPNTSDESRSRRKAHSRFADRKAVDIDADPSLRGQGSDRESHRASRAKRQSGSSRAPPGGSYRIPEKGQIQIIIKNQNKTAVKLFLVPYDLAGMEPGTKTFVRQRSYSTGPVIDGIPNAPGTGDADRPILRYLIHLHMCCPSKGRFYLYKSIRVVFANRVPDGKEKLNNETTWPEPRFTPYKPIRVMHPPLATSSGPGAMLAADKAFRRRSSGFSLGMSSHHTFDVLDGMPSSGQPTFPHSSASGSGSGHAHIVPIDPIPVRFPPRNRPSSEVSDMTTSTATVADLRSPESSQASRPSTKDSDLGGLFGPAHYAKLSKGDFGYGGNAFSPPNSGSSGGTEGLLSQRLRSLGVKNHEQRPDDE